MARSDIWISPISTTRACARKSAELSQLSSEDTYMREYISFQQANRSSGARCSVRISVMFIRLPQGSGGPYVLPQCSPGSPLEMGRLIHCSRAPPSSSRQGAVSPTTLGDGH